MKKLLFPICLSIILIVSGCSLFGPGKNQATKDEAKNRAKIVNVEQAQAQNNVDKLDSIAGLAYGTDYALSKVSNPPPREVTVARDINQRVVSIAGSPTVEKMKEMQITIDKLVSQLETERIAGKKRLDSKDEEIAALQDESKALVAAKEAEIKKYMAQAALAAAQSDEYKTQLAEYQGWFGLKAVWKGLLQFVKSAMWILGIGGLLFLILRIASMSNPVCGAIFSIFEQIVGWVINAISFAFPKALAFAGHVSKEMYDASHDLLGKIVDSIQSLKQLETKLGHDLTVKELLTELDKTMDKDEKDMVDKIKKDFGY